MLSERQRCLCISRLPTGLGQPQARLIWQFRQGRAALLELLESPVQGREPTGAAGNQRGPAGLRGFRSARVRRRLGPHLVPRNLRKGCETAPSPDLPHQPKLGPELTPHRRKRPAAAGKGHRKEAVAGRPGEERAGAGRGLQKPRAARRAGLGASGGVGGVPGAAEAAGEDREGRGRRQEEETRVRGGAGPPPQRSCLPPALEGGPGLRQRRPRLPGEVKSGCGGLGRRGGGRRPTRRGWAGLGGRRRGEVEGRLGIPWAGRGSRGPWPVAGAFSSRSASPGALQKRLLRPRGVWVGVGACRALRGRSGEVLFAQARPET